jgi:hypothetical protein
LITSYNSIMAFMTSPDRRYVAVLLLCCGACQSYSTVSAAPAPNGQELRVTFNAPGAVALQGNIGTGGSQVEGKLQELTDSTITLTVSHVIRAHGADEAWDGERVTMSRSNIASIESRRTSVPRSVLAAAVIAGSALFIAGSLGSGDQTGGGGGGGRGVGH